MLLRHRFLLHSAGPGDVKAIGQNMAGKVFVVSDQSELMAAMNAATGGDTIELQSGSYGDLTLNGFNFSSAVTITSSDPSNMAEIGSIFMGYSSNITFDTVFVDFEPTMTTTEWQGGVRIDNSSQISFLNSVIQGGDSIGGIDPNQPAGTQGHLGILGYPVGRGFNINWSQDITISNCEISEFTKGINVNTVDGLTVTDSEFFGLRTVGIGGGDASDVDIVNNHFSDFDPWKYGPLGDHGDMIHFWTDQSQSGPNTNINISGNFLEEGSGYPLMGIYLDDDGYGIGYSNVTIDNNVMHLGHSQGLVIERGDGVVISNNSIIQSSGTVGDAPNIYLTAGTKNVDIVDNILSGISGPSWANAATSNITASHNLYVQIHDELQANYVGKLFVDGMTPDGDITDFIVLPGSPAEGYGPDALQFDVTPDTAFGYIADTAGDGLGMKSHLLDADHLFDIGGKIDMSGAQVTWDFGDGTTDSGLAVTHDFGLAGNYNVTATATLPDGSTYVMEKTVVVKTPVGLDVDFENGAMDMSDILNPLVSENMVSYDASAMGVSAHLQDQSSTIRFKHSEELVNNPEFTISLDFKKDAGEEAAGGDVIHFSGTAVVSLGADSISLRGKTDQGEAVNLSASGIGIKDANWHKITYSFSQDTGTATLYVDGTAVDSVSGLSGGQFTTAGHDFYVGSPFNPSFTGMVDNVEFYRGAVDASQAQDMFDNMFDPSASVVPQSSVVLAPSTTSVSTVTSSSVNTSGTTSTSTTTTSDSTSSVTTVTTQESGSDADAGDAETSEDDGSANFFGKILNAIVGMFKSIFGGGSSKKTAEEGDTTEEVTKPKPTKHSDTETVDLSDVVPVTEMLDETGASADDEDDFELDPLLAA